MSKYAFRVRKRGTNTWIRGRQFRRVPGTHRWTFWRSTFPNEATAEAALKLFVKKRDKQGHKLYSGHVFEINNKRHDIVFLCRRLIDAKDQVHYSQIRPMQSLDRYEPLKLPITADCSESTTGIFKAVGAPDPNGLGYNGSGFTGTIRSNLRKINLHEAQVGDLIVYGSGNGSHVVIIIVAGKDPVVFSLGQESGPDAYRHSTELAAHGGMFTTHDAGI